MARKVGDVQEVGDPSGLLYGFIISDDRNPANWIMVSFKTLGDAEKAAEQMRGAIAGAVKVEGPPVPGPMR